MAMEHIVTVYNAKGKVESVNRFPTQDEAFDYLDSLGNKHAEYKNEFVLQLFARNKKGIDIRF